LFWRGLTWRQQLVIKANVLMWANIAWVNGLGLYRHFVHTRTGDLVYAGGAGVCVTLLGVFGMRMVRVEELLVERRLPADHTTIWRWVQRYAPELDKRCRRELKLTNGSWRVDETYICQGSLCRRKHPSTPVCYPSSVRRCCRVGRASQKLIRKPRRNCR
jgi:hypothetical protein